MSHHEHIATTPQDYQPQDAEVPVADRGFEPYPEGWACPNMWVPRNVYSPDGVLQRDAADKPVTEPELGWFPSGTSVIKGVEYTRVGKNIWNPKTGQFDSLYKDVPTAELRHLQEVMAEKEREQRDREMGQGAAALAQETPAQVLYRASWEKPVTVPESDSSEWALTPEQADKLRAGLAAQQPQGIIDSVPDWVMAQPEKPVKPTPETPEQRTERIQRELDKLVAGLSEEDRRNLERYAMYLHDKKEAQKRGDGGGSTTYGQNAGQAYRAMSPEARALSSNYQALWDRL